MSIGRAATGSPGTSSFRSGEAPTGDGDGPKDPLSQDDEQVAEDGLVVAEAGPADEGEHALGRDVVRVFCLLDASTPSNDETARLKPEPSFVLKQEKPRFQTSLGPYGMRFWSFQKER